MTENEKLPAPTVHHLLLFQLSVAVIVRVEQPPTSIPTLTRAFHVHLCLHCLGQPLPLPQHCCPLTAHLPPPLVLILPPSVLLCCRLASELQLSCLWMMVHILSCLIPCRHIQAPCPRPSLPLCSATLPKCAHLICGASYRHSVDVCYLLRWNI